MRISYWSSDVCSSDLVAANEMILDVGPAAVEALADAIKTCRTLVWNGPLGAFETPPFDAATVALAKTAAALTEGGTLLSVATRKAASALVSRRRSGNRTDRKSVVEGKGVSVRVELGGRRVN